MKSGTPKSSMSRIKNQWLKDVLFLKVARFLNLKVEFDWVLFVFVS